MVTLSPEDKAGSAQSILHVRTSEGALPIVVSSFGVKNSVVHDVPTAGQLPPCEHDEDSQQQAESYKGKSAQDRPILHELSHFPGWCKLVAPHDLARNEQYAPMWRR